MGIEKNYGIEWGHLRQASENVHHAVECVYLENLG